MTDVTKFISGCMACLSAMVQLELPHVNILSKMDLVTNKKDLEEWVPLLRFHLSNLDTILIHLNPNIFCICIAFRFLDPEPRFLLSELNQQMGPQFAKLNKALIELVGELCS